MTCQICEEAAREYEATVEADEDCTEFMANAIRANCRHSDPDAETVRWIPVSERLPDENEHVQLLHRDGTQWVGYKGMERPTHEETFAAFPYFIDRGEHEHWEWEDITHWMPLPPSTCRS